MCQVVESGMIHQHSGPYEASQLLTFLLVEFPFMYELAWGSELCFWESLATVGSFWDESDRRFMKC